MKDQNTKTGGPARLDPDAVFVVRFREGSPPREPSGRVECVSSGKRASFDSTEELLAFMLGKTRGGSGVDRGS